MEPDPLSTYSPSDDASATPLMARPIARGPRALLRTFSPAERLVLYVLSLVLGISSFFLLAQANTLVTTEVPTRGGMLVEGAVGTPRFVNPILAVSQPDQDLATLTYSGLLRATEGGDYIPDIAESYEISSDGTIYTFHLRPGLTFHDGEPLTAADVLFTVALAQNADIKSPRRADWDGVAASAPDDHTVVFTLPHAYAPFRENATLGILPKHLWENVEAEEFPFSSLNTHPIGSGPFRVHDVTLDETGAPTEYTLDAFKHFALGEPHLTKIVYRAFANVDDLFAAYENGDIESFVADSPKSLSRDIRENGDLRSLALARVFGVFFNQNHAPIFAKPEVRAALEAAVDKDAIVESVLGGYGETLDGPIPPGLLSGEASSTASVPEDRAAAARDILTRNGWKFSTASSTDGEWVKDKQSLSVSLATADTEELAATAESLATYWRAAGIPTTVQVYPLSEFNQTILRPRAYDAVLFGEVVGRSLDLFAFWHSSQRNDPGLNLALYTSATADKALAGARAESDLAKREEFLRSFLAVLSADRPAIFLYAPEVAYIVPARLKGLSTGTLASASDRFLSVYAWYRDTERVWNIFSK